MNGPHDVGGAHGFGAVVIEPDEPVFHHDWERRVFGAFFSTWGSVTNLDEVRFARERIDPAVFLRSRYYERWVESLEMLLVENGVTSPGELQEHRRRIDESPGDPLPSNPDPALVERALDVLYKGGDGWRAVETEPRFETGSRVRTRNLQPAGHTRLPAYIRGHVGRIEMIHGAFVLPDTNHAGQGEHAQYVYAVRFEATELWGEHGEPNASVTIDLWESYLEEEAR